MTSTSIGMKLKKRTLSSPSKIRIDMLDQAYNKICEYYNVEPSLFKSSTREKPFVFYRQCAMKFMYEHIAKPLCISQTYVSEIYFNRNHTTLIHSMRLLENYRETGDAYWDEYNTFCRYMIVNYPRINNNINPEDYPTLYPIINN